VITSDEWTRHGDLLQEICLSYPAGRQREYEAGFRLLVVAGQRNTTQRSTTVKLSEEDSYEQRIKAWTDQGYARHDAEWRIKLQDHQAWP
jgi:hypothetical protein